MNKKEKINNVEEKKLAEIMKVFDWNFYVTYYDAFSKIKFNELQAMRHFKNHGFKEGRICCKEQLEQLKQEQLKQEQLKQEQLEQEQLYLSNPKLVLDIENKIPITITIINVDCMQYISHILQDKFNELGYKCNIVNKDKFSYYADIVSIEPNHYILLYCIFLIDVSKLVKNKYIIYNLEQNINDKLNMHYNFLENNTNLYEILNNSKIFIDYCEQNITVFKKKFNINPKLLNCPFQYKFYGNVNNNINIYKYDILFIGCLNQRRKKILDKLNKKFNIYIPDNPIYGIDLYNLFKSCKILLNIHFYENAILERPRLNEAMCSGIKIISEISNIADIDICKYYKDNGVDFVEIIDNDDTTELENKIKQILSDANNYTQLINYDTNKKNIEKLFSNDFNIIFTKDLFINKNEIAIISCNFGNYDKKINDLKNILNWNYFDWYYYTDDLNIKSTCWNIITDDIYKDVINIVHNNDLSRMKSKFIKTNFLNIFKNQKYKYVIWLDGSINISNVYFVNDMLKLVNYDENFYIFEHYKRSSIIDEYLLSVTLHKYSNQNLTKQINEYTKNDKYNDNKLYETGIFLCKNNNLMKKCMKEWWDEIVMYSYQCQISLPYILQKNNIQPYLLNEPTFKKGDLLGSVWINKLFGEVKNHN